MGITWIRNGIVVDRPAEEVDTNSSSTATNSDGRTYMDSTNATYLQDGTVIKSTDRVSIRAGFSDQLPPSGNISKTYAINTQDRPTQ